MTGEQEDTPPSVTAITLDYIKERNFDSQIQEEQLRGRL